MKNRIIALLLLLAFIAGLAAVALSRKDTDKAGDKTNESVEISELSEISSESSEIIESSEPETSEIGEPESSETSENEPEASEAISEEIESGDETSEVSEESSEIDSSDEVPDKQLSSLKPDNTEGEIKLAVKIFGSPYEYLDYMTELIKTKELPIFPSVVLAHCYSESGAGGYFGGLYTVTNNCFGIRAFNTWSGYVFCRDNGKVYVNYEYAARHGNDLFRAYDSIEASLDDYIRVVSNPRYEPARNAATPEETLRLLAACGYYEPTYCDTIISIMHRFNLKQYDN
ncbi:MAG: glucosaminidase domain-containing protein [Bacteroidaceae bacterium]|nr:glucosaminidase domain-containing protein [Bacteroidaceae bacterium]